MLVTGVRTYDVTRSDVVLLTLAQNLRFTLKDQPVLVEIMEVTVKPAALGQARGKYRRSSPGTNGADCPREDIVWKFVLPARSHLAFYVSFYLRVQISARIRTSIIGICGTRYTSASRACWSSSCTLTGWPVWLLSMAANTSATDCKLSSTFVSMGAPPSSHRTNFSISQALAHLGCSRRGTFCLPVPRLAPSRIVREAFDLAMIEDQRRLLALGADILLAPAVQSGGIGLRAFIERRTPFSIRIVTNPCESARVLAPRRVPGLRVEGIASRARQIGEDVQVMYCSLDHQGSGYLVAELAPTGELPAVARRTADQIVQRTLALRAQRLAQSRLVLVEAMAHRYAHLLPGALHLLAIRTEPPAYRRSAFRRGYAGRARAPHLRLSRDWRGGTTIVQKVRPIAVQRGFEIRIALFGPQSQSLARVLQRLRD